MAGRHALDSEVDAVAATVPNSAADLSFSAAGFTALDVRAALIELAEEGSAITDLPIALAVTDDDLLVITDDPSGIAPETRQLAASVLKAYIEAALGSKVNRQVFTADGTWTKPTGTFSTVEVYLIGAGGGGGSGRRGAAGTVRCGGGGGGSGGYNRIEFNYGELPATVPVTVGIGGAGGAAVTTDDTNGNAGAGAAGDTLFGSGSAGDLYARADKGSPGAGGTNAAGTAGAAGIGLFNGGLGGAASATGGLGGTSGFASMTTGGGAGGGVTSANVEGAGGTGRPPSYRGSITAAPGGAIPGGAGTAGRIPTGVTESPVGGSGGGGGAGSITTAGGAGGVGAIGAGGGGGGASLNGFNSGAGGNGGNGIAVIITR